MTEALRSHFADYAAFHTTAGNRACHALRDPDHRAVLDGAARARAAPHAGRIRADARRGLDRALRRLLPDARRDARVSLCSSPTPRSTRPAASSSRSPRSASSSSAGSCRASATGCTRRTRRPSSGTSSTWRWASSGSSRRRSGGPRAISTGSCAGSSSATVTPSAFARTPAIGSTGSTGDAARASGSAYASRARRPRPTCSCCSSATDPSEATSTWRTSCAASGSHTRRSARPGRSASRHRTRAAWTIGPSSWSTVRASP